MDKGEIARYEQFLLFPQCFQKACFPEASKGVILWEWVNSLPNDKIIDWSKFKAFADDKLITTQKLKDVHGRVENIVGKSRKCWVPAFSPFHTMFSKTFLSRDVKSQDCVVKS